MCMGRKFVVYLFFLFFNNYFFYVYLAGSVANVQAAIEHIFPLVYEFRKKRTPAMVEEMKKPAVTEPDEVIECASDIDDVAVGVGVIDANKNPNSNVNANKNEKKKGVKRKYPFGFSSNDPNEDVMAVSDEEVDDVDENV